MTIGDFPRWSFQFLLNRSRFYPALSRSVASQLILPVTYINANRLPSEKNYFYTTDLDSNKVAVCIPVYKRLHDTGNIKFLELPATGRLVEASYSGALSEKPSIYTAINNFMIDQHLKQVAQPLEQYNIADTMPNPGSNIKLKIYFPVF